MGLRPVLLAVEYYSLRDEIKDAGFSCVFVSLSLRKT